MLDAFWGSKAKWAGKLFRINGVVEFEDICPHGEDIPSELPKEMFKHVLDF